MQDIATPDKMHMSPEVEKMAQDLFVSEKSIIDFRSRFLSQEDDVEPAWFHYAWNDILLHGKRHFVCEGFRESAKTQIVIKGYCLHTLTFPKHDTYILFILNSKDLASARLKDISSAYITNKTLSANLIKIKAESQDAFEVNVSDPDGNERNVRIEAYGKGSSVRGSTHRDRRPDIVLVDDPQDIDDMGSDLTLERDWKWFMSDVMFLGQSSRIFLIGNNLGERCIAEKCIKLAHALDFDSMVVPIMNEQEQSNWSCKYPIEYILRQRSAYSEAGELDVWYRERMCKCVSPESRIITRADFRYYDPAVTAFSGMSHFMTVDLAISKSITADYVAMPVVGVSRENHWFLRDAGWGRFDPSQTINKIFEMVVKYRIQTVGVERVAYQAVIEHFLIKEMPKRNVFFNVVPLLAREKKIERMMLLQPRFNAGTVWFPKGAPEWLIELELQLLGLTTFGVTTQHVDLADALAYMEQIAVAPNAWAWGDGSTDQGDWPIAGSS